MRMLLLALAPRLVRAALIAKLAGIGVRVAAIIIIIMIITVVAILRKK